ncbi:MAG: flagellar biosynthesis protein FlhF [Lachnospiraceae bacterium]|nr:flagellar biosynthesis protein FlhF [Lachnospiraceae bacterium]MDD6857520.1 flagellar biosynthesis protein FlhF [Lachnospiraceae bacterium]
MIIKKFQASTEKDAILQAKEEMGSDAVVLNIKTIKHKGLKRIFKKDIVEVTAALEERMPTAAIPTNAINLVADNDTTAVKSEEKSEDKSTAIEEKLDSLQEMLVNQMKNSSEKKKEKEEKEKNKEENTNFAFIQLVYSQLLENEVDEKYANQIISEVESSVKKESNMDTILSGLYQKIILKLGEPESIDSEEKKSKVVFFVGPTGVGKTTTIAKLASDFKLDKKLKVAMITADTYRIAAVEQLRTYANILGVPIKVVYTLEELNEAIDEFKEYDMVLVDTAGRSHKNKEQCEEIRHLIKDCVVPEDTGKDIYLVLSAATKYKDLINIVDVYDEIGKYKLIFTKLDETGTLGNILNIRLKTGAPLSYVTCGQVVPDDIRLLDAQSLAKQLLGGEDKK